MTDGIGCSLHATRVVIGLADTTEISRISHVEKSVCVAAQNEKDLVLDVDYRDPVWLTRSKLLRENGECVILCRVRWTGIVDSSGCCHEQQNHGVKRKERGRRIGTLHGVPTICLHK